MKLDQFTRHFAPGDVIFREGEEGYELYFVRQGLVAITRRVGSEDQPLAMLEKGDFFGEMSVLEEYPERSATATAVGEVEVLALRAVDLQTVLPRNPSLALRMMAKLSERLREANRRLQQYQGLAAEPTVPGVPGSGQGLLSWAVLLHEEVGRMFPLHAQGSTSIGRHDPVTGVTPDVDLTLLDPERAVSRRHAAVTSQDGQLWLSECNARTNGTFVNGSRMTENQTVELKDGDLVQVALVPLRVKVVFPPR